MSDKQENIGSEVPKNDYDDQTSYTQDKQMLKRQPLCEDKISGKVRSSLLKRAAQKRRFGLTKLHANSCAEFAVEVKEYLSIHAFIGQKRVRIGQEEWRPRHGQMCRDMQTIFGNKWARKRGGYVWRLGRFQKGRHLRTG